jgi:hypothetical protein
MKGWVTDVNKRGREGHCTKLRQLMRSCGKLRFDNDELVGDGHNLSAIRRYGGRIGGLLAFLHHEDLLF